MVQKRRNHVKKDEPLFVIETDKVTLEIEAEADGILEIRVKAGTTVSIGQVVGTIDTETQDKSKSANAEKVQKKPAEPENDQGRTLEEKKEPREKETLDEKEAEEKKTEEQEKKEEETTKDKKEEKKKKKSRSKKMTRTRNINYLHPLEGLYLKKILISEKLREQGQRKKLPKEM
jgi:pyruvate/2-oxoglutarate dehydrogenase complex dihydrolipoamide acyltransferase (E2) component